VRYLLGLSYLRNDFVIFLYGKEISARPLVSLSIEIFFAAAYTTLVVFSWQWAAAGFSAFFVSLVSAATTWLEDRFVCHRPEMPDESMAKNLNLTRIASICYNIIEYKLKLTKSNIRN